MVEWTPPLEDFERIIKWTKNVLAYDPTNAFALLVFAEAHWFKGGINEAGYVMLCQAKGDDPHVMAMIEVAKAKYLADKLDQQDAYEEALNKSIVYGPQQAMNYEMLGNFYLQQGKQDLGEVLLKKSRENKEEYRRSRRSGHDLASVMDFCNTFYAGLYG